MIHKEDTCEHSIHVRNLSVTTTSGKELVSDVAFEAPSGTLTAIIGSSGCGKSTLLKALAGLIRTSNDTTILYGGHPLQFYKKHFPLAISYLPQFGTLHHLLTVQETLDYAAELKLPQQLSSLEKGRWLNRIAEISNIQSILDQPIETLSGGQLRRVALAETLVGNPTFLLLDELTTGLDTYADQELMSWLRTLATQHGKTILIVTHCTEHLSLCDSVIFMKSGTLGYTGALHSLLQHFSIDSIGQIFAPNLAFPSDPPSTSLPPAPLPSAKFIATPLPPPFRQFHALLRRQLSLLCRDSGNIFAQIALIAIFPLIVAIFAVEGLPQVRVLADPTSAPIIRSLQEKLLHTQNSLEVSSLISGLTLFQVILLTLLGANNGAREIAKERNIWLKERFCGLSIPAYISSKVCYVLLLSTVQALWMTFFVRSVCGIPGEFLGQFAILLLTVLSVSSTCLLISAVAPSSEKASLFSIYLVGFQLPLSGAALSLPEWLSELTRPFIAAYWGWSGYLRTMGGSPYFDVITTFSKTQIASYEISIAVLLGQTILSMGLLLLASKTIERRG